MRKLVLIVSGLLLFVFPKSTGGASCQTTCDPDCTSVIGHAQMYSSDCEQYSVPYRCMLIAECPDGYVCFWRDCCYFA
jgi:hypothetical protein